KFPHFQDESLRDLQPEVWVPSKFKGRPFNIFETGGTTGMPKQRIGWDDYKVDYEEFSGKVSDEHFPRGGAWLMVGPTGPRRLRLAIEHLANFRGSSCYFVDLDPRWVKKVISNKQLDQAKAYMEHVVDQAVTILKHRKVSGLFTTPKLLEALAEKINLYEAGVRGVFCGGTTTAPPKSGHLGRWKSRSLKGCTDALVWVGFPGSWMLDVGRWMLLGGSAVAPQRATTSLSSVD